MELKEAISKGHDKYAQIFIGDAKRVARVNGKGIVIWATNGWDSFCKPVPLETIMRLDWSPYIPEPPKCEACRQKKAFETQTINTSLMGFTDKSEITYVYKPVVLRVNCTCKEAK